MSSERKFRLPQFSLAGLFWFASAVAIGFAVSQTTAAEKTQPWFSVVEQTFYSPTLLAIAAVLTVYELVRQGRLFRRVASDGNHEQFQYQFAWIARLTLALGIAGLLLITQLINRQILVLIEPEEFLQYYGVLWPATLLMLMLLLAMRLMVARSHTTVESGLKRWGSTLG